MLADQPQTAMISCKECSTVNSLDSAFCKKCGKPLTIEEAMSGRERYDQQVSRGFELLNFGRTDEAAVLAENALLADPENLRALSLKALVLERRGHITEALACYEAIVERNPEAALEKMRIESLRAGLELQDLEIVPDRRRALMIAASAAMFVICLGAIGAIITTRPDNKPQIIASNTPQAPAYTADTFNPKEVQQATRTGQQAQAEPDDQKQSATAPEEQSEAPRQTGQSSTALPKALSGTIEEQPKPINPLPTGIEIRPSNQAATTTLPNTTDNGSIGRADPEPSAVAPKPAEKTGPAPVYEIKLSDPGSSNPNEGAIDANGVEALVRAARSQYQVSNFQAAAATYEKALRAGADPGSTNQRLGQCYERLGRVSDAAEAYNRAISSIERQINSGKAKDKDRLLAALESSRQALKNIQGG